MRGTIAMRAVAAGLALAAVVAGAAVAAPAPTYSVTFSGSGAEHQLNNLKNIQDSGVCDSAEHIDVTGTMTWSATWNGFRPGRRVGAAASKTDGSTVQG